MTYIDPKIVELMREIVAIPLDRAERLDSEAEILRKNCIVKNSGIRKRLGVGLPGYSFAQNSLGNLWCGMVLTAGVESSQNNPSRTLLGDIIKLVIQIFQFTGNKS